MAKIIVSYGVHRSEVPAAKIGPEIAERLRKMGHEVKLVRRDDSDIANVFKLRRILACFSLLKKKEPLMQKLPFILRFRIGRAEKQFLSKRFDKEDAGEYWKTLDSIHGKLKNVLSKMYKKNRSTYYELKNKLYEQMIDYSPPNPIERNLANIEYILRRSGQNYIKKLLKKYDGYHIFDIHNTRTHSYAHFDEQLPLFERLATKGRVEELEKELEEKLVRRFTPKTAHMIYDEKDEAWETAKELWPSAGILFLHETRDVAGNIFGKNYVQVELPMIARVSRGLLGKMSLFYRGGGTEGRLL